jgi:acyl carrier protein
MILVGNSNVDCFNRVGIESTSTGEPLAIQWVGALRIEHFFKEVQIGKRVGALWAAEAGWKFLSIGIHDIYVLYQQAGRGNVESAFTTLVSGYETVFAMLGKAGKAGWLMFPQPIHEVKVPNVSDAQKLAIAQRFNQRIAAICGKYGIAVVNPLARILGPDGSPRSEFLQQDKVHLNPDGTALYLEAISQLSGVSFNVKRKECVLEPRSEHESFCSLVINNLALPVRRSASKQELTDRLVGFMRERALGRGLDLPIDAQTPLASSGMFDSLDLVELYTAASETLGIEMNFEVNLRELDSIANIVQHMFTVNRLPEAPEPGPIQSDFVDSLRLDFSDPAAKAKALEAEARIGSMSDAVLARFEQAIAVASEDSVCLYGMPVFWRALNQAGRGNFKAAVALLENSGDPRRTFRVREEKVLYYREEWVRQIPPAVWTRPVARTFALWAA